MAGMEDFAPPEEVQGPTGIARVDLNAEELYQVVSALSFMAHEIDRLPDAMVAHRCKAHTYRKLSKRLDDEYFRIHYMHGSCHT